MYITVHTKYTLSSQMNCISYPQWFLRDACFQFINLVLPNLALRFGFEDNCPKDDPLSQESFRKLSSSMPFSKQQQSKLVCYISKEPMDTENPPLVLPNGYVYSTKVNKELYYILDFRIIINTSLCYHI